MNEIQRRRTFAIISHPDAGKTTLTEKFLLFGGQIQVAGAVKSNKIRKTATSDWMDIERQRGISVTTSVMEFDYRDYKVNILDTPGHQDFAEDTFRTLTAVDSAIIVVDSAKGVEAQTRKLMNVCRMRNTPVIIFVNKMDREGKDAFSLLDELEEELQIKVRPLSWPINQGFNFKGVYNIYENNLNLFAPDKQKVTQKVEVDINSSDLEKHVGEKDAEQLRNDLELVNGVYSEFNREDYLKAEVAPVFFGSALNNFGVTELLDCFVEIAPSPQPVQAEERLVKPEEPKFTGFVFKITANIDPNHRSCIAFCKICSGKFVRNTPYLHVRQGKTMRFSSPAQFMAQRKSTVDEAFAGDIVGLPDNGVFKIGDTLTEGEQLHFKGLPSFSPEMFKYIENADPMKSKQLNKGIEQLMDEGVAQVSLTGGKLSAQWDNCNSKSYNIVSRTNIMQNAGGNRCRFTKLVGLKAKIRTNLTISVAANTNIWHTIAKVVKFFSQTVHTFCKWRSRISRISNSISLPNSNERHIIWTARTIIPT